MRPQGAQFAESAKNRESVMSLGSIAHLQYYFARTGLLDGKGAQARDVDMRRKKRRSDMSLDDGKENVNPNVLGGEYVGSPVEGDAMSPDEWDGEDMMLPPTVSTYAQRIPYVEPPPDAETLRRELMESLTQVSKAMAEIAEHGQEERINSRWSTPARSNDLQRTPTHSPSKTPGRSPGKRGNTSPANGWHQISGMHMLDVTTLAIKAAKDYYTQHDHPQRLHQIRSERKIREDLLSVMDTLKKMAARNFHGGMRDEEAAVIGDWVREVSDLLVKERRLEAQEARDRKSWRWLAGSWPESERRRREHEFMNTFLEPGESMPDWEVPEPGSETPTALLAGLRDGLILVTMHNRILKKSRRQFGQIESYHIDTAKPYRAAENLRFWLKAAELRFEVKLELDVMGVVYGTGQGIWEQFDRAVLDWCQAVREEITADWKMGSVQVPPPIVVAGPQVDTKIAISPKR